MNEVYYLFHIHCRGLSGKTWTNIKITYYKTDSMGLSHSWEANSLSATQDLPTFYEPQRFIYLVHKSLPLSPILSQINPVHTTISFPFSLGPVLILSYPHLGLPSSFSPSGFPTKTKYAFLFSLCVCYMIFPSHPPWLWSFWLYLVKSKSYEATHYVIFSNLLLFQPSQVQIFSSAPCFQTP
jgi:hypothetical protein